MGILTVNKLIKELQKWEREGAGEWNVGTSFYDNSDDEVNWWISSCVELEDGEHKTYHGPTLVLRP